mgnify:FL=1
MDGPIALAQHFNHSKIIYLSSEAVERALHTNYGMHKALAEMYLRTTGNTIIARICKKVTDKTLPDCCAWLAGLATVRPGLYRWTAEGA